ncbi:MAG: FAD-dependent oxidoreductase [Gammaproteobacteria bacterium]|jgi:2,4-dienoyl-CoA reductase-like NADH-dependent reductase (Old Yellow Enzyme family)/thioredoxin reductase|nr:FAD-dependent oxidoreductase [Gammaproteobacteria bacterium]MBT4492677.1 FAD-dependent oxidoreductase [Gammaproteobacteria bacterium]MBT7371666.1 FAD-dependent oxidoreductase [Gammaproteobacteria bacterium]
MKLLSPIEVGPIELKNRVVSTAHAASLEFFNPISDGERYMAYLERRAEGGTGLIILTAMHVHASSQIPNHYVFDAETMAPKFAQVSTRLHRHGAKCVSQLFHFGAQGKSDQRDDYHPLWSFSGTTTLEGEVTHKMTDAEIEEVIDAFAFTAKVATENGMDGVELHGTHGYLIQQSFSPYANKRDDKWGEDLYFVKTLAKRVREAIGPDKLLGFRISGDDFIKSEAGGLGHERLCEIASTVIDTGMFNYLNHSEGAGGLHYARAIGTFRHKFGEYLPLTRNLRDAIGARVPLIGVGKIPTPDLAEQALQDGDCDMVGMTRAQIADPDLVKKVASGQAHRLRTCTGSNQGCFERASYPITCFQNPEVGEENRFKALDIPIVNVKKVLVIGGGPAGMKAAEIAARRGHSVTLVEAGTRLGGRLNLVETAGDSTNLLSATAWVEQELADLDVNIVMQTKVDEAYVKQFKPEAIILATGAYTENDLDVPTDGSVQILSSDSAAMGEIEGTRFELENTRCLMIDLRGNHETGLVLESLAQRGSKVTLAIPGPVFGRNLGISHIDDFNRLVIPKYGVQLLPSTVLTEISQGRGHLLNRISGEQIEEFFDFVVAATSPKPRDELYQVCSRHAPTTLVGDAVAPRDAMMAFREGDRAGRTV